MIKSMFLLKKNLSLMFNNGIKLHCNIKKDISRLSGEKILRLNIEGTKIWTILSGLHRFVTPVAF